MFCICYEISHRWKMGSPFHPLSQWYIDTFDLYHSKKTIDVNLIFHVGKTKPILIFASKNLQDPQIVSNDGLVEYMQIMKYIITYQNGSVTLQLNWFISRRTEEKDRYLWSDMKHWPQTNTEQYKNTTSPSWVNTLLNCPLKLWSNQLETDTE